MKTGGQVGQVWQLRRGDELVGEITVEVPDFPWLSGTFTPTPAFEEVKPLFDEELALLEAEEPAWERAYRRINDSLSLIAPGGQTVAEFLLHVQGTSAWFRWSDEPFTK